MRLITEEGASTITFVGFAIGGLCTLVNPLVGLACGLAVLYLGTLVCDELTGGACQVSNGTNWMGKEDHTWTYGTSVSGNIFCIGGYQAYSYACVAYGTSGTTCDGKTTSVPIPLHRESWGCPCKTVES
jgi:hypothetical protein